MMGFSRRRRTSEGKFFPPANSRVVSTQEVQVGVCVGVGGCIAFPEQARKALSERSPFDSSNEDGTVSSRVSTLPVGFADILSKYSSNTRNKRQKKSHGVDAQTQSHNSNNNHNIWADTEDYFRPVALDDVEHLATWSSSSLASSLATQSCFSILPLSKEENVDTKHEIVVDAEPSLEDNVERKEDEQQQQQHCMEVDSVVEKEMKPSSPEFWWCGLEWLLGSRNKILLTSERPSKKRKLLGIDAGRETLR